MNTEKEQFFARRLVRVLWEILPESLLFETREAYDVAVMKPEKGFIKFSKHPHPNSTGIEKVKSGKIIYLSPAYKKVNSKKLLLEFAESILKDAGVDFEKYRQVFYQLFPASIIKIDKLKALHDLASIYEQIRKNDPGLIQIKADLADDIKKHQRSLATLNPEYRQSECVKLSARWFLLGKKDLKGVPVVPDELLIKT